MVLRRRLAALGVYECQTIKLIADHQLTDALPLRPLQDGDVIRVKLPLSEDHAVMRPSIVPGLVASAARNVRQQAKSLRFFEMGRVFRNAGGGKAKDQESETLAILLSGGTAPAGWNQADRQADLYDLKGLINALVPNKTIRFSPARARRLRPRLRHQGGRPEHRRLRPPPARPRTRTRFHLARLRRRTRSNQTPQAAHRHRPRRGPPAVPRLLARRRDGTRRHPAQRGDRKRARQAAEPLLIAFECFDVFTDPTGQKLPADRKSVAYRFQYRAADRTLKAEEVDAAHQKVLEALTQKLGVKFR